MNNSPDLRDSSTQQGSNDVSIPMESEPEIKQSVDTSDGDSSDAEPASYFRNLSLKYFASEPLRMVIWKLFPLYLFGSDKDSLSATDSILQVVPQTMMAASSSTILCNAGESDLCRDDSAAFLLKLVAIASILLAGAAGVSRDVKTGYPDPFRPCHRCDPNDRVCSHVSRWHESFEQPLAPCLPEFPCSKFPFPGFFAMLAALITLLVDFCYRLETGSSKWLLEVQVGSTKDVTGWSIWSEIDCKPETKAKPMRCGL
ncbi:hypothetical protein DY000_02031395 [Brassica cretica]|uniref:CASP-like protein n=1 Tax=Brassica cretica TaxID=69181 RepID=A0ABQ7DVL2_BRACR|nr:hypothetical protein DY000_02031395 [Brassica cretica]